MIILFVPLQIDMKNTLSLIRQKRGHGGVRKYIEQVIGVKYRTFVYQIEKGTTPYWIIRKLIDTLDVKFEDFKDFDFEDHSQTTVNMYTKKVKERQLEIDAVLQDLDMPTPKKLSDIFGKK